MNKDLNIYLFELIQVAVGTRSSLSCVLSESEWAQLRLEFKKQALLGIGYVGVTKLPAGQTPPIQVLAQWVHNAEKIRKKNERLNAECVRLCEQLEHDGLWCCVLKGQSNLVNYVSSDWINNPYQNRDKNPSKNDCGGILEGSSQSSSKSAENLTKNPEQNLALYRTPGDIDVWCAPIDKIEIAEGGKDRAEYVSYRGERAVIEYALMQARLASLPALPRRESATKGELKMPEVRYHHVELTDVFPVDVEIHHRPSFMCSPWRNRRLRDWCREQQGACAVRWGYEDKKAVGEKALAEKNKNQKNPSVEDEPCGLGANACPSENSNPLGFDSSGAQSSPVCDTNSSSTEEKNSRFAKKQFSYFPIPTNSFNAIYQLVHIYRHLFDEGIGLRQLLDYYFVLRSLHIEQESLSQASIPAFPHRERASCGEPPIPRREGEKPDHWQSMGMWAESIGRGVSSNTEIMHTLGRFGMKKFAGAVMWVLQTAFAMPDVYLLCPPNEKEGKFLLNEIMMGGNFGRYDTRINHEGGQLSHAWEKTKHNLRLLTHYPEEVMWEPWFRLYHWLWRKLELWRF